MTHANEDFYLNRISELESENARLKESLEFVKAERKELRDELYGPVNIDNQVTEGELIEVMKNHVPGSGARLLAEWGISPRKSD
jgi:hypothetical protein